LSHQYSNSGDHTSQEARASPIHHVSPYRMSPTVAEPFVGPHSRAITTGARALVGHRMTTLNTKVVAPHPRRPTHRAILFLRHELYLRCCLASHCSRTGAGGEQSLQERHITTTTCTPPATPEYVSPLTHTLRYKLGMAGGGGWTNQARQRVWLKSGCGELY